MVKVAALTLIGVLCVQAAWALVVPPFRGMDEHDHAFKAAAVALGDWGPTHEASVQGWGWFMNVPTDLVIAAEPVCDELIYTTRDNCRGVGEIARGVTRVSSSAARYNPAFYSVLGHATSQLQGAHVLYGMRAAAILMCAVLLAMAAVALRQWSRSWWTSVAFLLVLTPTATYSLSMAAPNGVELASGLLVWCALLGVARHGPKNLTVALATLGAVPLAVVRGMGPIWLLLIVASVAVLVPRHKRRQILRRRATWLGAILVLAACVYAAWWTLASSGAEIEQDAELDGSPWAKIPGQWVLWFFQSMGAFPARDEMAHPALYAAGFIGWWVFVALALRWSAPRERTALGLVLAVASAIPIAITLLTYSALGTAWQGRYTYPFAMGFVLICGYALDQRASRRWAHVRWPVVAAAMVALTTHLVGQLGVLANQIRESPLAGTGVWLQPHYTLIIALNVIGFGLLAIALTSGREVVSSPDNLPVWSGSRTTGSTSSAGPAARY